MSNKKRTPAPKILDIDRLELLEVLKFAWKLAINKILLQKVSVRCIPSDVDVDVELFLGSYFLESIMSNHNEDRSIAQLYF